METRLIAAYSIVAFMIVEAAGFAPWLIRESWKDDGLTCCRRAHRLLKKRQHRSHAEVHQRQVQQEAEHNRLQLDRGWPTAHTGTVTGLVAWRTGKIAPSATPSPTI